MARELTIYGERQNVSVIRERDGERTIYEIDLRDVDLFKSPAYYLQQNDIVYVQPNKYKERQSTVDNKTQWITSLAISGSSILLSVATIITNFILMQSYL
jgi:polysaccharide export outer membrane protein